MSLVSFVIYNAMNNSLSDRPINSLNLFLLIPPEILSNENLLFKRNIKRCWINSNDLVFIHQDPDNQYVIFQKLQNIALIIKRLFKINNSKSIFKFWNHLRFDRGANLISEYFLKVRLSQILDYIVWNDIIIILYQVESHDLISARNVENEVVSFTHHYLIQTRWCLSLPFVDLPWTVLYKVRALLLKQRHICGEIFW